MGNIFAYIQWRGDLTLCENPFGEVDNLIEDHPEVPAPGGEYLLAVGVPAATLTECGTAFCIAGYIVRRMSTLPVAS